MIRILDIEDIEQAMGSFKNGVLIIGGDDSTVVWVKDKEGVLRLDEVTLGKRKLFHKREKKKEVKKDA